MGIKKRRRTMYVLRLRERGIYIDLFHLYALGVEGLAVPLDEEHTVTDDLIGR